MRRLSAGRRCAQARSCFRWGRVLVLRLTPGLSSMYRSSALSVSDFARHFGRWRTLAPHAPISPVCCATWIVSVEVQKALEYADSGSNRCKHQACIFPHKLLKLNHWTALGLAGREYHFSKQPSRTPWLPHLAQFPPLVSRAIPLRR